MKRLWFVALLLAAVVPVLDARAHAIIMRSRPSVNAIVPAGDIPVSLTFNSRIDATLSKVTLIDSQGGKQDLSSTGTDSLDMLKATASAKTPGNYKLRWQVLSVDGHITRGDIPFTVASGAAR